MVIVLLCVHDIIIAANLISIINDSKKELIN